MNSYNILLGARAGTAALLLLLAPACLTVKPVVLDRKTQLENQILGMFQQLDRDLVLASSVRQGAAGQEPGGGKKTLSPLEREAVEAQLVREFHLDDLEALKAAQVVGEGRQGLLVVLSLPEEAGAAARAKRLVSDENNSREVIISRVVQLNRDLGEADLPLVRSIFHRLVVQGARPGELVQGEDGKWRAVLGSAGAKDPGGSKK